jgi:glutathione S-transferase
MRQGPKDFVYTRVLAPQMKRQVAEADLVKGEKAYHSVMELMTTWLEGSKYLVGDKLSIADIITACEITQLECLPPESWTQDTFQSTYPIVSQWYNAVKSQLEPEWTTAHATFNKTAAYFQAEHKKRAAETKLA